MATKKKKKDPQKTARFLVMDFGRFKIVGEDERYFYCETTQFFKKNKHIQEIVEEPEEEPSDKPEEQIQRENADE